MKKSDRLRQVINLWRLIPGWICVNTVGHDIRELIIDEIRHWNKCYGGKLKSDFEMFSYFMLKTKEYRSLAAYRLGQTVRKLAD